MNVISARKCFFIGWFWLILLSSLAVPGKAGAEAVSELIGKYSAQYTCDQIKEWAQSTPEKLFILWAESGEFGSNSALAMDIIDRGNVKSVLENIGDLTTLIQGLEEAANGTYENAAKIFADWLLDKAIGMTGSGLPGAVWSTCKILNDFAVALNAEILDLNIKTFAKFAEKDPGLTGPDNVDYFLNEFLKMDEPTGLMTNLRKKRSAFYEYVNIKLGMKSFPPMKDWRKKENWNMVRSAARSMLNEVNEVVEKRRKFAQLQGELKVQVDALKREQSVLVVFQALRDQARAMTCQDTASQDCLNVHAQIVASLQDLIADAGDIKLTGQADLDEIKRRLAALEATIQGFDQTVGDDYRTRVDNYCNTVKAKLEPLLKTISIAKSSNPKIAARAVAAKGFRDKACSAADEAEAKQHAASAASAANEAYLISQGIAVLPGDLDKYIPPQAVDFSGTRSDLAGVRQDVARRVENANEEYKKWQAFRSKNAGIDKQLDTFRNVCGKNDLIQGAAASLLAGQLKGQQEQIASQVPDVRYIKNSLEGFLRTLSDLETYLGQVNARHDRYRQCLSGIPDTTGLAAQAKALVAEATAQVRLASEYAERAKTCADTIKPQKVCGENEKLDANGNCVCKDGYVKQNGNCVKQAPEAQGGYFISGPSMVTVGDGVTFRVVDGGGKTYTSGTFSWFTSDTTIMSLGRSGVSVSGAAFKPGTCTIVLSGTGTPGGLAVTHTLTINPQCQVDANCPAGKVCQNGVCIDDPNQCTGDADCPAGKICQNGQCVDDPNQCRTNADCPPDHACIKGKCVYQEPKGCRSDNDCPAGYVCNQVSGDCVSPFDDNYGAFTGTQTSREDQRSQNQADQAASDQNTAQSGYDSDDLNQSLTSIQDSIANKCRDDSGCPSGFKCKNGDCVKKSGCTGDQDCAADQMCQNGKCVARPTPAADPQPTQQTPAQADTLAVNPPNKVIAKTESASFKAILTKGDGTTQDVTAQASWSPGSTFSSSKIGSHKVTATYNSLSASADVTVMEEKGLGDITVNKKTITVTFWDHGTQDGDMIDININGKAVFPGITLTNAPQSRTITLTAGALVFGFTALNEGKYRPNTATVEFSCVTSGNKKQEYKLSKNQKANMNITYSP